MVFLGSPSKPVKLTELSEQTKEQERKEILLRAVELIERDGFTTTPFGMRTRRHGKHCVLGAIAHAMVERGHKVHRAWPFAFSYEMEAPAEMLGADSDSIWKWNDQSDRRSWEATQMLRNAAHGYPW